jgi:GNAT superfamily N-acetyltransferase
VQKEHMGRLPQASFQDGSLNRPCPDRPSRERVVQGAGLLRGCRKRTNGEPPRLDCLAFIGGTSLAFTTKEAVGGSEEIPARGAHRSLAGARPEVRIRPMHELDLERILEFRAVVSWAADPRAFDFLRGMKEECWMVVEADGAPRTLVGMVGAVPLGNIGVLCHLAVHHAYRKLGLGAALASWAVSYLRSRGAKVVRLDSTVYRLEDAYRRMRGLEDDGWLVSPLVSGNLPELYGVDRWSFGDDRSALMLATLRLHPGSGLVARDASGRIRVASFGTLLGGTRVGCFMAATPDAARALLACALDKQSKPCAVPVSLGDAYVEIGVPVKEGPAHGLLDEFGFVGREDRLRMELGEAPRVEGLQTYGTTPYLAT